ncbi:arylsulfatase [uncultured Lutibacter sp.]|uniref:sulfatase family protein n=1 Tax=uncultured Lutibacter sp. TaxID=437739 RepID=UPI002632CDE8|nr:arylsulfatase [uncultured Lutibacter sp.]
MKKLQSKLTKSITLILCFGLFACSHQKEKTKPNVVIIYGDDVGFGDIGVYGATKIPTPNIDNLAANGIRFTDGHCSAATCTPSRFSLLTGTHAFRYGASILPPDAPLIIPTDMKTLADVFKESGYATSVIGKWHLGIGSKDKPNDWNTEVKPGPLELGFDYSFLVPATNDRVPCVYLENYKVYNYDANDPIYVTGSYNGDAIEKVQKQGSTQYPDGQKNREAMTYYESTFMHDNSVINGIGRLGYMSGGKKALWNDETMADVLVGKAKEYIIKNKEKPFFLYLASQDIHVPRVPHPRFRGKSELGYRVDAMVQLDWTVGAINKILKEQGLSENTIVIFSSDNGPVYDDGYKDGTTVLRTLGEVDRGHDGSGKWRGGKYQIYEGGTRIPFIVSWPGTIKPTVSNALVSQVDFLASFAALTGYTLDSKEAIDSRNMLDVFLGTKKEGLPYLIEERFQLALRKGNWKYIEPKMGKHNPSKIVKKPELYNLLEDPSEQHNIVEKYLDKAQEMQNIIEQVKEENGIKNLK